MPRPALIAAVAVAAVVVAGAVAWWEPQLTVRRDYPASVPQPLPLASTPLVDLAPRQRACFAGAVMDARSEEARFRVGTFGRPGQPLVLAIDGGAYRVRRPVAGGYPDNALLEVSVPPPRSPVAVTVCLRNAGRRGVALYAADDRTKAPYVTRVDDRVAPANPQFAFFERATASIAERLPTIVDRLDAFRPAFVGAWLLWPLLALVALGVPLLVAGALAASLRR